MTEKLKQTIEEELTKLQKENQEAIGSLDWVKLTEEIGKKYSLNESEINNLQVETLLVLVGITDPQFYVTNVENQVGTTTEEANKIAEEVFQNIFTPINDKLLENIKKSGKVQNSDPGQTLDFILSGGDYSAFAQENPRLEKEGVGGGNEEKNKVPTKPTRITDIRSKFTI